MADNLITIFPGADGGSQSPAVWADASGTVHRAVGADVHPGIRLLWTACESADVPANGAWLQRPEDTVTCAGCLAKPGA